MVKTGQMILMTVVFILFMPMFVMAGTVSLIEVGNLDTPIFTNSMQVVGSLAYVADKFVGLRIIDVSFIIFYDSKYA